MKSKYDQAMDNPDPLSLISDIAVMETMIQSLCEKFSGVVEKIDAERVANLWGELCETYQSLKAAYAAGNVQAQTLNLNGLGQIIGRAELEAELQRQVCLLQKQIQEAIRVKSRATQVEWKRQHDYAQLFTQDFVQAMISCYHSAAQEYIKDQEVYRKFDQRADRLVTELLERYRRQLQGKH
jgi:hypothetical protein